MMVVMIYRETPIEGEGGAHGRGFRMIRSVSAYPDIVRVGSTVVVRNDDHSQDTYVITSPREAEPRAGRVSSDSPLGRALLGRRAGEQVTVAARRSFTVVIESVASPA